MHKIKIASVGKTKESWLEEAFNEYVKRLRPSAAIECVWFKTDDQLETGIAEDSQVICLDPGGREVDSVQFANQLEDALLKGGSRLTFVIGGAEGLTPALRKNYPLLRLSKMTFTHQITRLILIEQLYRAFSILKNTPYHK
jgi:23S rRNA (pseudouridine1915-N3)-methyltransferase